MSSERIAELKRLIKAAANRTEEVREQSEVLRKREIALLDWTRQYIAELRTLTGEQYPVTVDETAPDRESSEDA